MHIEFAAALVLANANLVASLIAGECVYAVLEAKQTANADLVKYATKKVESVRKLQQTSLPIPYTGGVYPPKPLNPILRGVLTFESDWNTAIFTKVTNPENSST